jgi:DNA-binding NtrC family response regulator
MSSKRILVIDDDEKICEMVSFDLIAEGYEVDTAQSAAQGLAKLDESRKYDLILLDIRLPDGEGVDVLKKVQAKDSTIPVIMISAYATVELAVEAVKEGAYDFISKPFELDEMHIRVRNAMMSRSLSREVKTLRDQLGERFRFENIIGKSENMQKVYRLLGDVSASDATVLITGESGTGKELVARAIHANSPRCDKPFVVINSAAIPDSLLESELFGHEKGSFTGAVARKIGKFEAAEGGSVFLDEIGDLSPPLQVKLLRVLQEREFERVGGLEKITVDVRIISATNKNLQEEVNEKRFREDLFYRLNVLQIELPPLRERREDIPMLAMAFLERYSKEMNKQVKGISRGAMELLQALPWRGNVRELENAIERAVVMTKGEVLEKEDFPLQSESQGETPEEGKFLRDTESMPSVEMLEKEALELAIDKCGGNITKAAKKLGIGRDTMYRKMRKYGIVHRKRSK